MLSYNQLLEHLERHEEQPLLWSLDEIIAHQGPLHQKDPNYQNSKCNVTVKWSNGEITDEPLTVIALDAPVACAIYAKEKKLLNLPGWKRFKTIAKQQGKLFADVNKVKLRNCHRKPKFKYGIEIPQKFEDIDRIDTANGNTAWKDALKAKMDCMNIYKVYEDAGK